MDYETLGTGVIISPMSPSSLDGSLSFYLEIRDIQQSKHFRSSFWSDHTHSHTQPPHTHIHTKTHTHTHIYTHKNTHTHTNTNTHQTYPK